MLPTRLHLATWVPPSNSRISSATISATNAISSFALTTANTVASKTYSVERSTSLAPNQWITLQSNVAGDGSIKSFTANNPGTATRLFYRVASTPIE